MRITKGIWALIIAVCLMGFVKAFGPSYRERYKTDVVATGLIQLPESEYKSKCRAYSFYYAISYLPSIYYQKLAVFEGEVAQIIYEDDEIRMRINITKRRDVYTNPIYIFYTLKEGEEFSDLDIVRVYGELRGIHEYEGIIDSYIEVPKLYAQYIDLVS